MSESLFFRENNEKRWNFFEERGPNSSFFRGLTQIPRLVLSENFSQIDANKMPPKKRQKR